ncbi:unnamed protein product [Closterium sp. NIES-53]
MASLRVLAFDHEGRPIQFDTWLDHLQLYLLGDSRDIVSLFDHTSGASPVPPATPDSATRSQWLTRDGAARLAICNHLPLAECAHFGQHRTAQALYDAVVARYSSPAIAALGHLLLPYLFPKLSAFATVEDLVTHLRTSDARYRTALPAEFLDRNPPPMYITLYFIVTHLPGSLRALKDHFLALDPTALTVDLLEGVPPPPLPPPMPLLQLLMSLVLRMLGLLLPVGSAAAARARVAGVVVVAAGVVVGAVVEVVAMLGVVAGVGALVAAVVAAVGVAVVAAVGVVAIGLELFRKEVLEVARGSSSSVRARPRRPSSILRGFLSVGHLGVVVSAHVAWRAKFGDEAECPRWAEFLRSGVAIFDLDYDAILAAMYALSNRAEGDCYLCVPPDPGIEAAALGTSESALPRAAPAEALHTFTLGSGASRCFFCDSTTLTPLSAPVPVRLADPSKGLVLARSYTVLPWSSLYTLASEPSQVATSAQVSASGLVAPPCLCRLLSHQTLLWHNRLGHPSLPCLRGMHSRLLVSGLPRSLLPLPPSPAPPCLACVERRQRAAPHSSFPPTSAPLQTLHMDVSGPARVSRQGRKRYFLLVVDDYTRYTTVFPLHSKGEVPDVLIPWICAVRLQLRERFGQDLPVLRLHSDRSGEFSSDHSRDFVLGLGLSCLCSRYVRGQALRASYSLRLPWLSL